MAHTHGRYMQDLGFGDGIAVYGADDVIALTSGGSATLTRNAAADFQFLLANSTTATLSINLLNSGLIQRTGFFEDTQNVFGSTFGGGLGGPSAGPGGGPTGGTGIPASAEPQGRPGSSALQDGFILPGIPQPASGMGALQEITPRTGLKLKGVKPLSIAVIYKVVTNPATTLTCRLDKLTFVNGVANAPVNLLASGANGLTNVAAATPVVVNVAIPNAVFYQVTDLSEMWFELSVITPAGGTFQYYGCRLIYEFNFN